MTQLYKATKKEDRWYEICFLIFVAIPICTIGLVIGFISASIILPFLQGFLLTWKEVESWLE